LIPLAEGSTGTNRGLESCEPLVADPADENSSGTVEPRLLLQRPNKPMLFRKARLELFCRSNVDAGDISWLVCLRRVLAGKSFLHIEPDRPLERWSIHVE
jgi:hypothetical protein